MKPLTLTIAILFFAVAACHKPFEPAVVKVTTSDTTLNFENSGSTDLSIIFYSSYHDIAANHNAIYTCHIPGGKWQKIPFSQVGAYEGKEYFLHVSTADRLYSNWGSNWYFQPLVFSALRHSWGFSGQGLNQALWYFLHDTAASVTWRAIDKRLADNTSVWPSLNEYERFFEVTINRDQTGAIRHKTSAGGVLQTDEFNSVRADTAFNGNTILNFIADGVMFSRRMHNTGVVGDLPNRDTMVIEDASYYWVVVRK